MNSSLSLNGTTDKNIYIYIKILHNPGDAVPPLKTKLSLISHHKSVSAEQGLGRNPALIVFKTIQQGCCGVHLP